MKKPISAAIYCRVATADQLSLDLQEQRVCDYAKAKSYEISSITKEAYKGSTMKRPGIQRVLDDAKDGKIDILLMLGISRLGRNTVEVIRAVHQLEKYGVEVETVHEGVLLDQMMAFLKCHEI